MASDAASTTADQNGPGESVVVTSPEVTEKLSVHIMDVPPVEKSPDPAQESEGAGDKPAEKEPSADEASKLPQEVQSKPPEPSQRGDSDDETTKAERRKEWEENRKKLPRKAAVRWSDYEHFKNRYGPDEGLEIIEVLYGHPGLGSEVAHEEARRAAKTATASRKTPVAHDRWIHRVRIESTILIPLLAHFSSCDGAINSWTPDAPRVFFRPFVTFYHTLPLMKKCVEILENQGQGFSGHMADLDVQSPVLATDTGHTEPALNVAENGAGHTPIIDCSTGPDIWVAMFALDHSIALQHLRVYIDFVEKNIIPLWDEAAGISKRKVRFCDLPMFFRPSELLISPLKSSAAPHTDTSKPALASASALARQNRPGAKRACQNIWKMQFADMSELKWDSPIDWRNSGRTLTVRAYHVEFDGDAYGSYFGDFSIEEYAGEKDIRSLLVYPLRYEKERPEMIATLQERGKRFLSLISKGHCYYDGWSLLYNKLGANSEKVGQNAEYIDGEIMIDFKEGGRADSDLVENVTLSMSPEPEGSKWSQGGDEIDIKFWADSTRTKLLGESTDTTQIEERFTRQHHEAMKKRDYFIRAFSEERSWLKEYTADLSSYFDNESYVLLPQRIIAYSFRARKFFLADIDSVSTVSTRKHAFRDLRIDPDHKRLVKSLVRSHFEKQSLRRQESSANLDQDFIRGKGAGLVMLLHGVPGVGKTTTAEAVALHTRKPLFTITSGDLGFTPAEVEIALKETFRLAQMWDCVLLLDEADLFLSRRAVQDMQRNALVSVFLRVLEYYNGILFLTTNRVGTIDEAFKSRIHVSLYYPPLNRLQTLDIFRVNLRRLHEIEEAKMECDLGHTALEIDDDRILSFAYAHFNSHLPTQRWNGRQIRNAFQVAYSLAQFDVANGRPGDSEDEDYPHPASAVSKASSTDKVVPTLDDKHFMIVNQSIEKFDHYLVKTRGTDEDTAKAFQLRNDSYHDPREDNRRQAGPAYQNLNTPRLHLRQDHTRSPDCRGSMFDPPSMSQGFHQRDMDDDDERDDDDGYDTYGGGPDYGKFRQGGSGGNKSTRQPLFSSHSTPAAPRARRGLERHYGSPSMGGGDEFSPDDTGYDRGGSNIGGRANSHISGGYER
ncbi:hypothetical protein Daus18300_004181 [Diaporthe australafricana]|uniref:AAA+ ATPase domain-containing protein n=1 Tax=Diaporthe australafricana TaxID=127596 RepID=A0ABR3XAS4_9PEZI